MASNEVEVLDPAPTVEKLKKFASERVVNRRHFIAAIGAAGAAVAGTELVRQGPVALAQQPKPSGYAQGDILNFLLNLNYLKATLYSFITQGADLPQATFTNLGSGGVFNPPKQITTWAAAGAATATEVQDIFNEMYYDEVQLLVALRALIGTAVGSRPTMNLAGTGTTTVTSTQTVSQNQAIGLLRMLEDLTASAYAGATVYLTGTNLAYATQALATIGFHAGALRLIAIQGAVPYVSAQILTTTGPTTQSQNSFTGSLVTGSTTLYNFAPTNPITVGTIITGTGIPLNTTVTAVNPPTVYTGTLSGSTATPNQVITNVTPLTNLAVGMALTGTGIPSNSVITAINGNSVTVGTITGYSSLTPPTPVFNGVTGISISGGYLLPTGTYPLSFSANSGASGATGSLTVVSSGTSPQNPATYSITLLTSGTGYLVAPTVTATGLAANTGGLLPSITATVAGAITASTASVTITPGFTAATTKGSTGLIYVSQTAGLTPGQLITGSNLPSNEYISTAAGAISATNGTIVLGGAVASATSSVAPTGFVTKGSAVVTAVSSTSGVLFGMPITGTGIAAGSLVTSIGQDANGPNITMSAVATTTTTGTSTNSPTAQLTNGSTTVQALSSLTGLAAGNTVTGTGIPSGTKIFSVGSVNTMVLTQAATASTALAAPAAQLYAQLQSGNNIISYVTPYPTYSSSFPSGLKTGQLVQDSQGNIPAGTTLTAITASNNTITLSAPATGASTVTNIATFSATVVASYETISSVPATAFTTTPPIAAGMGIVGTNIPAGTVITAVNASLGTITISQFPTAAAGAEVTAPASSFTVQQGTTLSFYALQSISVTGPTTSETVTIPTVVNMTPSLGTATLSQAATVTGPNTLILQGSDPMDVDPVDPGSAATSAGGPSALPGSSPTVYQGFFDTAGGATSTANNPPGSVFARTFSQVLADLYGSTASQTYEGGFFPVGIGGPINFV